MESPNVVASRPTDNSWERIGREVTDMILDVLWGDTDALRASALVCRDWTSRCQMNLLYDVRICGQRRINEFLRAVTSFSERARPLFAIVRLVGPLTESPDKTTITRAQLVSILDNLPSVQHVVFRNITLAATSSEWCTPFAQRAIDTLIFVDVTGSPDQSTIPAALILFLSLFHSIRYLCIMRGEPLRNSALWEIPPSGELYHIDPQYGGALFPPYLRIEEASLTGYPTEQSILPFLRYAGMIHKMHQICVKLFDQNGLIELADFLADCPEQVELISIYLTYHLREYMSFGFPKLNWDPSRFASLRSILLHCAIRTWVPDASFESCDSLLALLEVLAGAPALAEVEIGVTVRWNLPEGQTMAHFEVLDDIPGRATPDFALDLMYNVPWERLDSLLRYASLERIVIVIYKSGEDWYAPEDYMLPILNNLPWPKGSGDVEVITDFSFWEDTRMAEIENVLAI